MNTCTSDFERKKIPCHFGVKEKNVFGNYLEIEIINFKKELEFLDKTCIYYEFSKWKFSRPLKKSHSLVIKVRSRESIVNQIQLSIETMLIKP